jgi:hypothetical protein
MVPLPDGTYMIMNGAHQGLAGFGLATNPNLGALLYDPAQPVNQRISILNTTIVARLYHSEVHFPQKNLSVVLHRALGDSSSRRPHTSIWI